LQLNTSLISVIIPCYNQAQFLDACLESVYSQTYRNWECLIINDGSNDDSEGIANTWVYKDSRFIYLQKENGGVSSARNLGLDRLKGDYIQFLDADDVLHPEKFELSLAEFVKSSNTQAVFSNFERFQHDLNETLPPYCLLNASRFNLKSVLCDWNSGFSIPIHCGLIRVNLFETVRFSEELTAQEDWLVWVKLFKNGCQSRFLDKPLAYYRINPNSRMRTKGIYEDQMQVIQMLKGVLDEDEYQEFIMVLISRYYESMVALKKKNADLEGAFAFRFTKLMKKIFKKLGLQ